MSLLTLSHLSHAYLGRDVLRDVSLSVGAEILALIGPSGCGKSTLIQLAAGLMTPKAGRITRGYRRQAMVFQDPRLLPWATARQNIAFAARLAPDPQSVTEAALAAEFDPADLGKYPAELSGGMRQRVALARALVVRPDFVLFDEPFTALDAALKRRLQDLVVGLAGQGRLAGIFVTHDLTEAARIAHRVAVMAPRGVGILGTRALPGQPGQRDEATVFALTQAWAKDPLFAQVHEIDERALP